MKENSVNAKQQLYKTQLRKNQLECFFQKRRSELLKANHREEQFKNTLKTAQDRNNFIHGILEKLQKTSFEQWQSLIQQLSQSLKYFKGNFQIWLKMINCLNKIFKKDFIETGIIPQVARLIADMISLTSPKQCPSNVHIIDSLVTQDIIILLKQSQQQFSVSQQLNFALLLGNLCTFSHTIRETIVSKGGADILALLGQIMLKKQWPAPNDWIIYLGCCQSFATVFKYNGISLHLNPDTIVMLLPTVLKLLEKNIQTKVTRSCAMCLSKFLQEPSRQISMKLRLQQEHLYILLHKLLVKEHYKTKDKILMIFNLLCFHYPQQTQKHMWSLPLFDTLETLLGKSSLTQNFNILSVNLLINMINSPQQAQKLLTHILFDRLVRYIHHNNQQIKQQIYRLMQNMGQTLPPSDATHFLQHFRLIPVIIFQIQNSQNISTNIARHCLAILLKYLKVYSNNAPQHFNSILQNLQSKYSILDVICSIYNSSFDRIPGQDSLSELAGSIIDLTSQCTSSPEL